LPDNKISGLDKGVGTISSTLMRVCMGALLIMMFWGTADVTGRYIFNRPIVGTMEIFEILLPVMALCGWAYTQRVKAHIRVEIIYSRIPPRPRAILGFVITLWAIVLFSLIVWRGTLIAILFRQQERIISNTPVPIFFPQLLVPLGGLVMLLVLIFDLRHFIVEMRKAD